MYVSVTTGHIPHDGIKGRSYQPEYVQKCKTLVVGISNPYDVGFTVEIQCYLYSMPWPEESWSVEKMWTLYSIQYVKGLPWIRRNTLIFLVSGYKTVFNTRNTWSRAWTNVERLYNLGTLKATDSSTLCYGIRPNKLLYN